MAGPVTSISDGLRRSRPLAAGQSRTLAVVLNHNGTADTIRCIEWLSGIDHGRLQVLVVDNASAAGSVAAIRAAHPTVDILALPVNLGFSAGNNRGILHAAGRAHAGACGFEFIWLVNNDTYGAGDALAALVATARADEAIGAVGSVLVGPAPTSRLQSRGTRVSPLLGLTWNNHTAGGRVTSLCGASLLVRTAALEQVGLLDETFFFCWEDADLCGRLRAAGWKLAVAEKSIVTHKEGASAAAASPFRVFHHVRGIVLFARRHSPIPWFSATFAALLCAANCLFRRRQPALLKPAWCGFVAGWQATAQPIPAFSRRVNEFTSSGTQPASQDS